MDNAGLQTPTPITPPPVTPPPPTIPPPVVPTPEPIKEEPIIQPPSNPTIKKAKKALPKLAVGTLMIALLVGGLFLGKNLLREKQRPVEKQAAGKCEQHENQTSCLAEPNFCTGNRLYECDWTSGECIKDDIDSCDSGTGDECNENSHAWCIGKRAGYVSECDNWDGGKEEFKYTCNGLPDGSCSIPLDNFDYDSCGPATCNICNDESVAPCIGKAPGYEFCLLGENMKCVSLDITENSCPCGQNIGGSGCSRKTNCNDYDNSSQCNSHGCVDKFYDCKWMDGSCRVHDNRACSGNGSTYWCNDYYSAPECLGVDAGTTCKETGTCEAEVNNLGKYWEGNPKCNCNVPNDPDPSPSPSPSPFLSPSPSPPPEATMSCVSLTGDTSIEVGDIVTFTCKANFSAASPVAYFRYKYITGGGIYTTSEPIALSGTTANYDIIIDQAGNWIVQCQVCTDDTASKSCTVWGQAN